MTPPLTLLVNAYRLAFLLCLLQIGSALAAICLYGLAPTVGVMCLQITPIAYSVWALADISRLLPYTRRTDTTIRSRVGTHYNSLIAHYYFYLIYAISMYNLELRPSLGATCRANTLHLWQCIPFALNDVLLPVLIVTLLAASQVLRRRAIAIHGVALVPMPEPVPRPWGYFDRTVWAWKTPHLAEFELPVSVEETGESEKVVVKSEKAVALA
ncbi:hypothetical protein B0H17DRAFT_1092513 [Mycena rosella]|uniref:Uncharacterized protein n=1 Tax=Mycena rosella TaxID=1033263 RepID=A0AAD7CUW7_MYCRO|nr:hypothetical protein B0H17DRAFT_1092513 [Mycena rosella]